VNTTQKGNAGETAACTLLEQGGYTIVKRNHRAYSGGICVGEIDIIAQKGEYIVFAEVKTRKAGSLGSGAEAVDTRKRRRLLTSALLWVMENNCQLQPRFDVIEVTETPDGGCVLNHIENAFGEE